MLVYTANLPPITTPDVTLQELTIDVDGLETSMSFSPLETVSSEFHAPDNANVKLTLVYVDDASNRSVPRVFQFVATDTIAPDQPGELSANLVREE